MFDHHAYLISGEPLQTRPLLDAWLLERSIPLHGNPDLHELTTDTVSVDEARAIGELQMRRALSGSTKIFIISFTHMSQEAQNALLKIFEEPTSSTAFFLLTAHPHMLLPTLRSRMETLVLGGTDVTNGEVGAISIDEFLAGTAEKRLELIEPLLENKDKGNAIRLLNGLEERLHADHAKKPSAGLHAVLKDLEEMRGYIHDRGASLKLLLEFLAVRI